MRRLSTILRESEIRTPPVDDLSYAIFVMRFIRPFALIIYFINNIHIYYGARLL